MAAKFPQRRIGDDLVSAVGLGCMGMSVGAPPDQPNPNDEESLRVSTRAADLGINLWNTSDMYGPFTNERLIGRWFQETGRRDEIFLATKFGLKMGGGKFSIDGTPGYVREACEASLARLQTDRIDLFLQTRVDAAVPIEQTVAAMAELQREGKIRHLGLSECSARTLRRAHAVHPIAAAEMEFSPFALEIESGETDFLRTARDLGVKVVAYAPLGRGFFTGAFKSRADLDPADLRLAMHPRFSAENFDGNLRLADALAAVADEKGCRPGQLALAWVLAQGDDFIPIPGTKRVKYLEENAAAVRVEISPADDARIRRAIEEAGGSKGARYPAAFMSLCFGDTPELQQQE